MALTENKTIELWDGYSVELKLSLFDDVDFLNDLNAAIREDNLSDVITMSFATVGGEKTYEDARKFITDKCGHFSMKELQKILDKIGECFPKVGNRASRRQKWTTK